MVLPTSGEISASDINVELGRNPTDPFSLNGTEEREFAGILTGPISLTDFYGLSAGFTAEDVFFVSYEDPNNAGTWFRYLTDYEGNLVLTLNPSSSKTSEYNWNPPKSDQVRIWDGFLYYIERIGKSGSEKFSQHLKYTITKMQMDGTIVSTSAWESTLEPTSINYQGIAGFRVGNRVILDRTFYEVSNSNGVVYFDLDTETFGEYSFPNPSSYYGPLAFQGRYGNFVIASYVTGEVTNSTIDASTYYNTHALAVYDLTNLTAGPIFENIKQTNGGWFDPVHVFVDQNTGRLFIISANDHPDHSSAEGHQPVTTAWIEEYQINASTGAISLIGTRSLAVTFGAPTNSVYKLSVTRAPTMTNKYMYFKVFEGTEVDKISNVRVERANDLQSKEITITRKTASGDAENRYTGGFDLVVGSTAGEVQVENHYIQLSNTNKFNDAAPDTHDTTFMQNETSTTYVVPVFTWWE